MRSMRNKASLIILLAFCWGISIVSCAKKEDKNEEILSYYQQAKNSFFEESNFEKADILLKEILNLNPEFTGDYFNFMLGYIYEMKHCYNKAIERYKKELEVNKRETSEDKEIYQFTLFYLARSYFNAGLLYKKFFNLAVNSQINYYNTKLLLRKGIISTENLRLKPEDLNHLLYFRGLCYYLRGDFNDALNDLKKVEPKSPLYLNAVIKLGACYHQLGRVKEARQEWEKIYRSSKHPIILCELGYTYCELGMEDMFNQVQKWAEEASDKIGVEKIRKLLCVIYFKNNNIDKAVELLNEIQLEIPELTEERGEYIDKESNIKVKYVTKFYDPSMLNHKADIYLTLALKYYRNYLEFGKNKDLIYKQIGLCQLYSNKLEDAILTFNHLIKNDDSDPKIRSMSQIYLGMCHYLLGAREKAFILWDNVYKNNLQNYEVLSLLGVTYAMLGIRLEEAIKLCKTPRAELPGELSWNLGIVYFKKGLKESNIECFSESIGYLEKNHTQKGGYNVEVDNPLLLSDMASAYYNRRLFQTASCIAFSLRQYYPEVEQIFNVFQVVSEIKGMEGIKWEIDWKDICL